YYLVRRHGLSGQFVSGELWVADLANNRSERALPGFEVTGFDVSANGKEVVFAATDKNNVPGLWLASLDLQFSPRGFASTVSQDEPHFDAAGNIYFRASEGSQNFIYRMKIDGSDRQKAYPNPVLDIQSVSPDGNLASVWAQIGGAETHNFAVPLNGGNPVMLCTGYCGGQWNVDGKVFFLNAYAMDGAFTLLVSVPSGGLPPLPASGVQTRADTEHVKGGKVFDGSIVPGPIPGQLASLHEEVHRNLYRIPLQ